MYLRPGIVVQAKNPSCQEVEIRKIVVPGQAGQKVPKTPILTNGWMQWSTPVISAIWGSINRRIAVQRGWA
jgi:hypothetical protein